MLFDNRNTVLKLNKIKYLTLLGFVTILSVIIWSGWFDKHILGLNKLAYIIFSCIVYILFLISSYISNYNYFSFNDEGDFLTFKFASFRPFDNEKKAIKIEKRNFVGYELKKSVFNLRLDLLLKVQTSKGIANYPPVSISALTKNDIVLLKNALGQYS